MADLSKLSDEDLMALKANDLSKVSDEGLAVLSGKPIVQIPANTTTVTTSPAYPFNVTIYANEHGLIPIFILHICSLYFLPNFSKSLPFEKSHPLNVS